ncbi:uncharacterized protein BKCO1_13000108 [Diplodia corticola]|uniref:Uncharacterized protein n=1 Tax=Diplodia corticola TaxID=236234 RepID=A0A1J9R6M6_9PEZI|nr:uncharacterized protein BKCO1_13000108 [Diplodia corticola]OJD36185.1 hypothetical protein BKCO1_13000108 [Diplodia corticola]
MTTTARLRWCARTQVHQPTRAQSSGLMVALAAPVWRTFAGTQEESSAKKLQGAVLLHTPSTQAPGSLADSSSADVIMPVAQGSTGPQAAMDDGRQPSTVSRQPSAISHQPSAINQQPKASRAGPMGTGTLVSPPEVPRQLHDPG